MSLLFRTINHPYMVNENQGKILKIVFTKTVG